MARPVFIIDGSRTPFLKARSGPGPFTPVDLAVQCGRPLLARQPFAPTAFDQVILGCVNVIADEMNPARVAAFGSAWAKRWSRSRCRSIAAPACSRSTPDIAISARVIRI